MEIAIIGGSRAYDLMARSRFGEPVETFRPDTPFGASSPIHRFRHGEISYLFLSRHGESGYSITAPFVNYRANIWALKEMGVERIISWSQPGGINPKMKPGDLITPTDAIDMTRNRKSTYYENSGLGFVRMSEPFCREVREQLFAAAEAATGETPHAEGVYCCTEGPRLETPAEIRMFAQWGADLVGMTLLPEAFLARELEICYGSLCLVSNFAEGVEERAFKEGVLFEGMLSGEEENRVEHMISLLPEITGNALEAIAKMERGCDCGKAMERYRRNGRITGSLQDEIRKLQK